jgi:hypothetical protein
VFAELRDFDHRRCVLTERRAAAEQKTRGGEDECVSLGYSVPGLEPTARRSDGPLECGIKSAMSGAIPLSEWESLRVAVGWNSIRTRGNSTSISRSVF